MPPGDGCSFDILCVVKDVVDPILDERLARFVIGSHERSHPDADAAAVGDNVAATTFAGGPAPKTISQELLRKYITYAKDNCRPRLSSADYDKLATVRTPDPMSSHLAGSTLACECVKARMLQQCVLRKRVFEAPCDPCSMSCVPVFKPGRLRRDASRSQSSDPPSSPYPWPLEVKCGCQMTRLAQTGF